MKKTDYGLYQMLKQMKYYMRAIQKKRHATLYVSIDNKQHRDIAVTVAESYKSCILWRK